ncbi:unnamed protein product [Arctia plantaginis]|uniref:N-acetyltransferase domain-containing protein n=1 Tax=Arctia plantaginis TaxID=874455 RepID=A0A8S0Z503_ARCPL|nr:unnamed protein product [Arctia plantaginis]
MSSAKDKTSETGAVTVRPATRGDMRYVLDMIQELAEYEGVPDGPQITVDDLVRDGFDSSSPWFFGLIAELDGAVVGHAFCNRAYSSWTCRAYYLEDLYVRPHARRHRIGQRLMQELCRMAVRDKVTRIDWHVLADNAPALGFYTKLGARDMRVSEGRTAMRLDEPFIKQLSFEH